jgi:hypothetical protein
MDIVRYAIMRQVLLAGSVTILMAGCVGPYPPGYGGWPPQVYYDDGQYVGDDPYYFERRYYNGAARSYHARPRTIYYRDENRDDDRDRKGKKEKRDKDREDKDRMDRHRDKKDSDRNVKNRARERDREVKDRVRDRRDRHDREEKKGKEHKKDHDE